MLAKFAFITRAHKARVGPFVTRSIIPIRSLRLIMTPTFIFHLASLRSKGRNGLPLIFFSHRSPSINVQVREADSVIKSVKGISSLEQYHDCPYSVLLKTRSPSELLADQPLILLFVFLLSLSRSLFFLGFGRLFLRVLFTFLTLAHGFFLLDLGSLHEVNAPV